MYSLVTMETSSAANGTSYTSSKPIFFRANMIFLVEVPSLNWPKRLGAGRATLNLNSFNLAMLSVEAYLALLGHIRIHSPQSMHLLSKIYAFPFLTLIASVGHPFIQFVQPLHFSTSRVTEW